MRFVSALPRRITLVEFCKSSKSQWKSRKNYVTFDGKTKVGKRRPSETILHVFLIILGPFGGPRRTRGIPIFWNICFLAVPRQAKRSEAWLSEAKLGKGSQKSLNISNFDPKIGLKSPKKHDKLSQIALGTPLETESVILADLQYLLWKKNCVFEGP